MPTYVALLRGINVSGQKLIKMAELRAQLAELPYDNIRTYIQSGNILFEREAAEPAVIEEEVRQLIAKHYGFDVPVMVKTREDLDYVVNNHPFIHQRNEDPKFVHVTFLAEEPDPERVAKLREEDYSPEEWVLDGTYFYFFSPKGMGNAKMSNTFVENRLKVKATGRNWRTTMKLWEMAGE